MQMPIAPNRLALPGLLFGAVLIGCSPIWVRLSEVGPVSTAFWRLALALIPLALLAGGSRGAGTGRPKTLRDRVEVCLPGVILGAELVAWHISLNLTSVANSTLLVNMAPVFVALFTWIVLKKPPGWLFGLALGVTILGVIVLKGGHAALRDGDLTGDSIAIFAAVLYAAYILLLTRARQRFATGVIMLWSTAAAATAVFPFALITDPSLFPLTLAGWGVLIGLSWISQAGGQSMIAWVMAFLPASFSSLTLLLQPVIAALLAWAVLDEALTLTQALGGVIVLCGIWIARLAQMRQG